MVTGEFSTRMGDILTEGLSGERWGGMRQIFDYDKSPPKRYFGHRDSFSFFLTLQMSNGKRIRFVWAQAVAPSISVDSIAACGRDAGKLR